MPISFKGAPFPKEIILTCVRWYVAYPLSTRNLEAMMRERQVQTLFFSAAPASPCNQIAGRVQLTDIERKELAELGATLGKKALEEITTVAQPDTILAWKRKFADQKVGTSVPRKSVGRPRVDQESADLVVRMARENRSWGYDRIQGALKLAVHDQASHKGSLQGGVNTAV